MAALFVIALFGVAAVQASPALVPRQSITALTTAQVDAFSPYTYFASAAYCVPSQTLSWTCGANCNNNTGFEPVASGGDGSSIQYWYVGYDSSLESVIVAHQGTNPRKLMAVLTDVNIPKGSLDPTLFPGVPSQVEVHDGFRNEQAKTASAILSAVQTTMSKYGTTSVSLVGHSLGAALSLLDSVYLPLHLPSGTTFQTVLYGLPRVGNQDFANYVDANLHVTHINNLKDPVPIVPGRFLGFHHPSGEVHITEAGLQWMACPGQDNPSKLCIVGDEPNVFDGNVADHDGPYNGIEIGC